MHQMSQLQLRFKGQNQKITLAKSLSPHDLQRMIAASFGITEKVIGVTNLTGRFFELGEILSLAAVNNKEIFSLVTAQDLNQDSMSFGNSNLIAASQYYGRQDKAQIDDDNFGTESTEEIPTGQGKCMGIIADLQLFEELFLVEDRITVVASFIKTKPPSDTPYEYYLFQNDVKNSVLVYTGTAKACEFYVSDWSRPNPEAALFISTLIKDSLILEDSRRSGEFKKRSKIEEGEILGDTPNEQQIREGEIKQSFLENLSKLREEGEVSDLQFYRLKSQVLQNPSDFMRKYQMGSGLGLREQTRKVETREELRSKQSGRQMRRRSASRTKRYEIPIIVRKYNNVVEKITTSYPLTLEQEQAINLILELELKGLISEKEARQVKSSILQEEQDTFKLFREYFNEYVDEIELASKLRKKRGFVGKQQGKERVEHDMRLLIKHAKQNSYQLLRKLAQDGNKHVLEAMSSYRSSKDVQQLAVRLEKIANYYRAKDDLQDLSSQ